MAQPLDAQITTRVSSQTRDQLHQVAQDTGTSPHTLARTFLEEALRRERHPGITFRAGPAGRRACIEGRRLDVWQVVETFLASDRDLISAAEYLGVRPEQVRAAVGYYAEHREEIDGWTAANHEEGRRFEAAAQPHAGMIIAPPASFPRSKRTIGLWVGALDGHLRGAPGSVTLDNECVWLRP